MDITAGARGEARLVVGDGDTALAIGSGTVEVLGTPRVIALCEQAAVNALGDTMSPGKTTVGMRVQVDHVQPTAVGMEVVAEAVLEKVEGRRLTFTVSATDPRGLVACGKVTRVMVDVDHFMQKSK